jgi:hypothetical protein
VKTTGTGCGDKSFVKFFQATRLAGLALKSGGKPPGSDRAPHFQAQFQP